MRIAIASLALIAACSRFDGDDGDNGARGPAGPQGEQGVQGAIGETGAAGRDGVDGTDGQDGKDFQPIPIEEPEPEELPPPLPDPKPLPNYTEEMKGYYCTCFDKYHVLTRLLTPKESRDYHVMHASKCYTAKKKDKIVTAYPELYKQCQNLYVSGSK